MSQRPVGYAAEKENPVGFALEQARRAAAERGSRSLLQALIRFARRHKPGSDLARMDL